MADLKPFKDDAASIDIGTLTIENGRYCLAIYGEVNITRDKAGLALAHQLKTLMDETVAALEATDLPDNIPPPLKPTTVKNPFS